MKIITGIPRDTPRLQRRHHRHTRNCRLCWSRRSSRSSCGFPLNTENYDVIVVFFVIVIILFVAVFFVLLAIVYCSDCYWWSNCDTCGSWSNISAEGPYSKVCNILNQTFCIGCTFLLPALLKYASRRTEGVCAMCINHQNHKNLLSRGIFVKNILC